MHDRREGYGGGQHARQPAQEERIHPLLLLHGTLDLLHAALPQHPAAAQHDHRADCRRRRQPPAAADSHCPAAEVAAAADHPAAADQRHPAAPAAAEEHSDKHRRQQLRHKRKERKGERERPEEVAVVPLGAAAAVAGQRQQQLRGQKRREQEPSAQAQVEGRKNGLTPGDTGYQAFCTGTLLKFIIIGDFLFVVEKIVYFEPILSLRMNLKKHH